MGKRSRKKYLDELLLDTSYVLPFVGIEVEEIPENIYTKILTKKLYYPLALVAELIGVIMKEAKKSKIEELPEEATEGFNSIIFGSKINLVPPVGDDLKVAYELIKLGWNDIFDALLYATAKRIGIKALSLDRDFKKFLRENGYEADLLVSHKEVQS